MVEPLLLGKPPPPVTRDRMVQLWVLTATVTWFGTAVWTVALAWVAANTFGAAVAGVVVAISTLPQALVTIVGGVVADRFDTRRVMVGGHVSSALVLVLGALLWGQCSPVWLLSGVGVAFGTITGLIQPATATLSRQLVATDDLATVSGWNQIATRLARLAGAPVGAWLVAGHGLPTVMVLDAITLLLAAAVLLSVIRPRFRLRREAPEPWPVALRGGVSYLRRDRAALVLVVGLCGLNVFSTPLISLGVPLRIAASGWPSTTLGLVEAVFSGCAILGSALALVLRPRRRALGAFVLLAAQGLSYALVAVPDLWAVVGGMAFIGAVAGTASVWLSAEFMRTIEPRYLGRVSSLSTLGDLLLIPVATPAFGALTSQLGIGRSPWVLAAAMAGLCLVVATRPSIRLVTGPGSAAGDPRSRARVVE